MSSLMDTCKATCVNIISLRCVRNFIEMEPTTHPQKISIPDKQKEIGLRTTMIALITLGVVGISFLGCSFAAVVSIGAFSYFTLDRQGSQPYILWTLQGLYETLTSCFSRPAPITTKAESSSSDDLDFQKDDSSSISVEE